jgi:RsiW-degrading membrane proteinase PrsW (M82 family)
METVPEIQPMDTKPVRANSWLKVLFGGFLLYVISLIFLILTGNPNLFPTVVLIGSFLIPVTYVIFFYERRYLSSLAFSTTILSFTYGGILGVLAASILEPIFVRSMDMGNTFVVGLVEEFAKILGVIVIARHRRHDLEMDGLIIGAAAGMGFAALESNGYAFTAFLSSQGSLSLTVFVTLLRAILSPFGHGTWTAILASVLFRESRNGHFRINLKVIGMYLVVAILHGLWDGLPGFITNFIGPGLDVFLGQALVGLTGFFILWLRWREARRLQKEASLPTETTDFNQPV